MVYVATGPKTSVDDENRTQLPMLLVAPTFSSYESSESMPSLLLVWCARLD